MADLVQHYPLKRQKKLLSLFAVIYFCICLAAVFTAPPWNDELNFHAPLACSLSRSLIADPQSAYSSAYPPLPYVVGNLICRIVPGVVGLRLINLLVAGLSVLLFWRLVKPVSPWYPSLVLAFISNPYFLRSACFYFMINYGLLFSLAAIWLLRDAHQREIKWHLGHLFVGLAVLSMQWLLTLAFAVAVVEARVAISQKQLDVKTVICWIAGNGVPLLPSAVLFYLWRGVVHPNFSYHALQPSFANLVIVLAIGGFLFWPWLVVDFPRLRWPLVRILFFLLPLLALSLPIYSTAQMPGNFPGLESSLLFRIEQFAGIPYSVALMLLVVSGIWAAAAMSEKIVLQGNETILITLFGLLTAMLASAILSSSHVYLVLPFLLLLLAPQRWIKESTLFGLNLYWAILSLAYLVYIVFFKSHGILL
ncbi:hypothetical protein JW992_14720 [candidate division KSB1 bacterium]|nr:hypothetical protein [candidate division KSB1 bacterium]